MKYSLLVVIHNGLTLTVPFLESVWKYSPVGEFELLVFDNNSSDNTKEHLQEQVLFHPEMTVFLNNKNSGFMSPMNFLASKAKGKYLVVLNNDLVVCKDWLKNMESVFIGKPRMAQVGLAGNCGEIGRDGCGIPVKSRLEYIEASCMMMPRKIYEKFGLFDDSYYVFGYYEDSDLSLRLREHGYEIAVVPLNIVHKRNSTMSKLKINIEAIRQRNALLFRRRWSGYITTKSFKQRVLFKRRRALGDVIMVTPVVEAYKHLHPQAEIIVATEHPQVFENNPHVLKTIDLNSEVVDYSVFSTVIDLDLSYEKIPNINVIKAYALTAGVVINGNKPKLYVSRETFGADKLAVFHVDRIPGWPGRNVPVEAFDYVAKQLKRKGYKIVSVGCNGGLLDGTVHKNTTFKELCSLVSSANVFVGHDSAPFHVAQVYGIPAVVPFGAILPELRVYSDKVFPVQVEGIDCLGCHHKANAPQTTQICIKGTSECMGKITGKMIMEQTMKAIGKHDNA